MRGSNPLVWQLGEFEVAMDVAWETTNLIATFMGTKEFEAASRAEKWWTLQYTPVVTIKHA